MAVSLHFPVSRRETLRWEFGMALGFATALSATALMTLFTAPWWLLAAGVAAAIVLASRRLPIGAAAFTGVVGWLCVEGFLLSSDGVLHWHGPSDLLLLAAILAAALAVPVTRRFVR